MKFSRAQEALLLLAAATKIAAEAQLEYDETLDEESRDVTYTEYSVDGVKWQTPATFQGEEFPFERESYHEEPEIEEGWEFEFDPLDPSQEWGPEDLEARALYEYADENEEESFEEAKALCEEAVNCEITINEFGDTVMSIIQGMEPDSEWWNSTIVPQMDADHEDDDSDLIDSAEYELVEDEDEDDKDDGSPNLDARGKKKNKKKKNKKSCKGKKKCTQFSMTKGRTNYGSRTPKSVMSTIRKKCGRIGCNIGSYGLSTERWIGSPGSATLRVNPSGTWPHGKKGKYVNMMERMMRSKTGKKKHWQCGQYMCSGLTEFRAARYFQINRYVRVRKTLAMRGSMGVSVQMETGGAIGCEATIDALTIAASKSPAAPFFGALRYFCNL